MDTIIRGESTGLALSIVLAFCIACHGQVIYVDHAAAGANDGSSWTDAYQYLQDGLAAAAVADKPVEVRVAQGVYKPDQGTGITAGDRAATFQLLSSVTLKGGYAGTGGPDPDARDIELYQTILSGDLADNDDSNDTSVQENSSHVVTGSGTDATAVIDGFTITGGARWLGSSPGVSFFSGAAGISIDAGSPTIFNCCFTGNYGTTSRGVVLATNGSNPVLTNCTFLANYSTGMSTSDNSNAVLTGCRFEGNEWRGVDIRNSSPVLTDCTFTDNGSREIHASDCNSVLTDCLFQGGTNGLGGQAIDHDGGHLSVTGSAYSGKVHPSPSPEGKGTNINKESGNVFS